MCRSAELWNTGTDKLGSTSSLWYWLTGWAWINYVSLSYPMSEVRGRSRKDPMPEGQRPRGVTPCRRSGAAAKSARLRRRRNGWEELPKCEVRGGGWEEIPCERGQRWRPGGATQHPQAWDQGRQREELPYAGGQGRRPGGPTPHPRSQGCISSQEGLEELSHVEGQEGRRWGDTPHPR